MSDWTSMEGYKRLIKRQNNKKKQKKMKDKPDVRHFEGSVSVDADITPVTRQPIESVDASDWEKITTGELHMQLNTLNKRLIDSYSLHSEEITRQLRLGIARLQKIIEERSDDSGLI